MIIKVMNSRAAADPALFYEANQAWPDAVRREVATHLREALGPGPKRCLFLGAATGVNEALPFARSAGPGDRILASDVDTACLGRLRAQAGALGLANVETRRIDITRDLDGLGAFDLVTLLFVIHRLEDWRPVVRPLAALVAPGGSLFVSEFAGPCGLIHRSNERGGLGDDPVSRLIRRTFEISPIPFDPPLTSTRIGPVRELLSVLLEPAGFRDFAWPQRITVEGMLRRMEERAYAPYAATAPSGELLERLRAEFERELSREVELMETIRLYRFARPATSSSGPAPAP